jgi:hypothetical protein
MRRSGRRIRGVKVESIEKAGIVTKENEHESVQGEKEATQRDVLFDE